MSDRWDFYFCNVNGELASIFVDLGIRAEAPQRTRPKLWFVWIELQEPRPDGLSSSSEYDRLVALEETLEDNLRDGASAVFVGRITTQGRRELYFYAPQEVTFKARVDEVMSRFPGYEYDCGSQEDPDWHQYFSVLYPSPEQMRCMNNRRVVEVLEEHGDIHTVPRQVDHWIFLRSSEDMRAMAAIFEKAGFEIFSESRSDRPGDEHPYILQIKRVDAVDQDSIDAITLQLFQLCQEAGAVYDGWETHVVKQEPDSSS